MGCQWTGNPSLTGSALDPPAAVASQGKYHPQIAATAYQSHSGVQTASTPASTGAAVAVVADPKAGATIIQAQATMPAESSGVPASVPLGPDAPHPQDDISRMEQVPEHLHAISSAAQLPAEKKSAKDEGYKVDRNLPSPVKGMITPILPSPEKTRPLSLGASLALAGVENPVIGIAEQAVRVSQAELLQARVLLVPNINVGTNYDMHNGPLQASFGGIRKVDRQAVMYGLGAYSVAAETVKIPGLFISTHLGDALFEPMVASRVVAQRRFSATATRNEVLLEVSTDYLDLLGSEGRLAVIRQSEKDFEEVFRLTTNFAKSGQGRKGDADRAEADVWRSSTRSSGRRRKSP